MDRLHPRTWFSPAPGTPGTIHSRSAIRDWYGTLAAGGRLRADTIGVSTEGNPIDALFIGDDMSDSAFRRIAEQRLMQVQSRIHGDAPSPEELRERPVVLVTSGIHATEIGGPQSIPDLVHWLVTSDDPDAAMIRDQVTTIVVPTLNPDGMDLVHRWHSSTRETELEGTLPPLLYHRFAGHDNNRDWVFRNLVESRVLLDAIHRNWLPHVTLDQHQMSKFGPRFALPPYCDPWNPRVPPEIIAASSNLGLSIAADLTMQGFTGVQTTRYFDAWEPSRAIQHFRGGIRILTEAASANLAQSIEISSEQLRECPMPMSQRPSQGQPAPWPGGTWSLSDIVRYHLTAAKSLLVHVASAPERYLEVQRLALAAPERQLPPVSYVLDPATSLPDAGAQQRLIELMRAADVAPAGARGLVDGSTSMSPLAHAVLQPTIFPEEHGDSSYDITSHYLPLMMGAIVQATTPGEPLQSLSPSSEGGTSGGLLAVDAHSHQAPRLLEAARRNGQPVRRTRRTQLVDGVLVQPGSWIIEGRGSVEELGGPVVTAQRVASLPPSAVRTGRRDIILLTTSDEPAADYGWTRLWLHAQELPFLEARACHLAELGPDPEQTILLLPEAKQQPGDDSMISLLTHWLRDGGDVMAFGTTARRIVPALASGVKVIDGESHQDIKAPGAIVSLQLNRSHHASFGLDRSIPAVYARDGAFDLAAGASLTSIAEFGRRNTVINGWMAGAEHIAGKAAVVEIQRGPGRLWAFSFRPLFRAQSLVTSPLVHNLLYEAEREGDSQ